MSPPIVERTARKLPERYLTKILKKKEKKLRVSDLRSSLQMLLFASFRVLELYKQ